MLITPRHENYDWGTMTWLADGDAIGASLAEMTVLPGEVSPAHSHQGCNEIIHLRAGLIEQRVGAKWVLMQAGDTVMMSADVSHQTRNIGQEIAVMTICYSSGTRDYQEVSN